MSSKVLLLIALFLPILLIVAGRWIRVASSGCQARGRGPATYAAPGPADLIPQSLQVPDRAAILERDRLGICYWNKRLAILPSGEREISQTVSPFSKRTS